MEDVAKRIGKFNRRSGGGSGCVTGREDRKVWRLETERRT